MIEWVLSAENTQFLRDPAEWITIIVSVLGIAVTLAHYINLKSSQRQLSKRLRAVFYTDALVYLVTFIMGVGLFYELKLLVHYDVIIRPLVLTLNVIAGYRLYRHLREL